MEGWTDGRHRKQSSLLPYNKIRHIFSLSLILHTSTDFVPLKNFHTHTHKKKSKKVQQSQFYL